MERLVRGTHVTRPNHHRPYGPFTALTTRSGRLYRHVWAGGGWILVPVY